MDMEVVGAGALGKEQLARRRRRPQRAPGDDGWTPSPPIRWRQELAGWRTCPATGARGHGGGRGRSSREAGSARATAVAAHPTSASAGAPGDGGGRSERRATAKHGSSRCRERPRDGDLWRGHPWNLEVDAVVNFTNESLDEAHSSPGLHAAAGPELVEECATLGGCRTGMAKMTNAYDLPARKVIHTVGPKYAVKYHTAAESALSHCYRSCLELLVENGLESIAMGCMYTEAKNYPREPAAHVAIRTVRRFLEKQKDKITVVVFCTISSSDTEIYKRYLD